MKTAPKFGKRQNAQSAKAAEQMAAHVATVREWMSDKADAATVNRLAAAIARR